MHLRFKAAVLLCLGALAAFTGAEAWRSLGRPQTETPPPQELSAPYAARAESAEYLLAEEGGFVAVYEGKSRRGPVRLTGIELGLLRDADQAMLRQGLPVGSHRELLLLLEDLGS